MDQKSTGEQFQPSATGYVTRPGVVTLICVVNFIVITFELVGLGVLTFAAHQPRDEEFFLTIVSYSIVFGITLVPILGMWYAKNWARFAYIIIYGLINISEAIFSPDFMGILRLPLFLIFCVLLFRPKASAYFRGETLPPIDPATGLEIGDREIIPWPACGKEIYSTLARCHHCGSEFATEKTGGESG